MASSPNTQPIYPRTVHTGYAKLTNQTAGRDPGSSTLVLLFEGNDDTGSIIDSIQVHYLGAEATANVLFLYSKRTEDSAAFKISETTLAIATPTNTEATAVVAVTLPPILPGTVNALKLEAGEDLYAALATEADTGFNVVVRGGDYS